VATGITPNSPFSGIHNVPTAGRLEITLWTTVAVTGTGTLADIHFNVLGSVDDTSVLDIVSADLNEGGITAVIDDGYFIVCDDVDNDGDSFSECDGDCDDDDPENFPGNPEVCDGQDNNCDDVTDEGGDALCADTEFCNGDETCGGVSGCQAGTTVDCTAFDDDCNLGVCNETSDTCEAQATNEGGSCGDGSDTQCTNPDTCSSGVCAANDEPDGTTCDDGASCTSPDECSTGVCAGVDTCPDGQICDTFLDTCVTLSVAALPSDLTVCPGADVYVPVTVAPADGALALDLAFTYDSLVLTATDVLETPLTEALQLTANLTTPGIVDISLFGTQPLVGSGAVAWVAFDVIGSPGEISQLAWIQAEINEGGLNVTTEDGLIELDAAQTSLSLPDIAAGSGANVIVPLAAIPAAGTSTELTVAYDSTVIQVVDVTTTPISAGHTLLYDDSVPGQLLMSLNGASPLTGSGSIVDIEFFVVGSSGEHSPLILAGAEIDAGAITTCIDDGTLSVCDGLVEEVQGLEIADSSTLTWADQGGGIHYDLVSGSISDLNIDGGVASATCLQDNATGNSYTDTRQDPATNAGYYYIVRAQNACDTGTYGYATAGPERLPTSDCP
jgi:hypothetical protein